MTTRTDRTLWYIEPDRMARDSEEEGVAPGPVPEGVEANLVSSRLENGRHSPVLDLDFEARLIPSRTPGHFHLYLDGLDLSWEEYEALIEALEKARVIGPNYAYRSKLEGMTVLRREGTWTRPAVNMPPPPAFRTPPEGDPW